VHLDLTALGVDPAAPFRVHDLLGGERFEWDGYHNYVALDAATLPAHVLLVEQPAATAVIPTPDGNG